MNGPEYSKYSPLEDQDTQLSETEAFETPLYFPVSILKLIVMSVCTMGIYDLYWFYKNWKIIKEREKIGVSPFWRAFFAYFFCYSLLKTIRTTAQSLNLNRSIAAGQLAAGWIIFTLLFSIPGPFSLLTYFAGLFLVPVQRLVNEINISETPRLDANTRFTPWNMVAILVGGIWFVLLAAFSFLPAE